MELLIRIIFMQQKILFEYNYLGGNYMDGVYQVKVKTPIGNMDGKIILKTNGEDIEGTLEVMGIKHSFGNGKVKGNQCYFKGTMKNNAMNIQYEIMGELQNNVLNIYAKTNMGEFKIQGRKVR